MMRPYLFAVIALVVAFPGVSFANQALTGTVKEVRVDDNARVIIILDPGFTRSGSASCVSADNIDKMTTSVRRDAGEAIVRVATAALLSGKTIVLRGKGTCDDWSGMETAAYVVLRK
ncbi:MAG: hypothetical protein AAFQ65_06145 [Myxococcota bacterium]